MTKVLVVCYYWPPAGGPGVQRWVHFVKYLREFGIEPVLFVPENPSYPILDPELEIEIPEGISVHRQRIFEPIRFAALFSRSRTRKISSGIINSSRQSWLESFLIWTRGNFFIPDARKYWIKPSVRRIEKILRQENINQLITTGPPHSLHLIGLALKRKLPIRWIADFRDPWTTIGYHKKLKLGRRAQEKHRALEKEVLESADQILTTSRTTAEEFWTKTSKPVTVITNGYEPLEGPRSSELDPMFNLAHIGSLLSGRNPEVLWKVLSDFALEEKAFAQKLRIDLVGVVSAEVVQSIRNAGLEPYLVLKPYVSHHEARLLQQKAQVLLLLEIDSEETRGIIPAKIFEYIDAARPVLALGPENWEAGRIVTETQCGESFSYKEYARIKNSLKKWYQDYLNGVLSVNPVGVERFQRRELARKLAEELRWES